jgi:hypothetical protein
MPGFDVWVYDEYEPAPAWAYDYATPFGDPHTAYVRISQSFIESWRNCPRSAVADTLNPTYGVAAAKGIAAHEVTARLINGVECDYREVALACFVDECGLAEPDEDLVAEILGMAQTMHTIFTTHIEPWCASVEAEVSASTCFDHGTIGVVVTGTADVSAVATDGTRRGWDWKTGAKQTEPWRTERYGAQAIIYPELFRWDRFTILYPFAADYTAKQYGGVTDVCLSVGERQAKFAGLKREIGFIAEALVRLDGKQAEEYPTRSSDWYCGPAWCQEFGTCVGKNYEVVPWQARARDKAVKEGRGVLKG